MNNTNIIVFDFETGGLDPTKCVPLQVGAMVLNPRTLEPIPKATFNKYMRPMTDEELETIEDGALAVNKIKRDDIPKFPLEKIVWESFTDFVLQYKTPHNLPIPAGQFIYGYDLIISERLCKKYGPWDKKKNQQTLWNPRQIIDTKNILFMWFENSNELPSYKMDDIRPYFGLSAGGAHNAMKDVEDTAWLIQKFMRLHRSIAPKVNFKGT